MQYLKDKLGDHFNKILLAVLFVVTIGLAVHLMHKSDAGGDDSGFIVWAETQAAFLLGRLVGIIAPDEKSNTTSSVVSSTSSTVPPK